MPRRAIVDSCFVIDWSKFELRDVLFEVFDVIYVTPDVLDELRSEGALAWVGEELAKGRLSIYDPSEEERAKALEFVELTRATEHYPTADFPEALGIVIAKKFNMTLLSENRAVLYAPLTFPEFSGVAVWRALDVLLEWALRRGACDEFWSLLEKYERQTKRKYSKRLLEKASERLKACTKLT
jgi:hypothetical protein